MKQLNYIPDRIAASKNMQHCLFFVVLILLSAAMVYLYSPFCPGHDSYFHFRRMEALMDGLNNPYLIYLDYTAIEGYGYFTKAFYPDFLLIPFAWLGNVVGVDTALQSILFVMTVLCGIFTYISVNRIYKNRYAAAVSALLYTFCLYRLLDIYHRGALGEAMSFTFIPLAFLGLYEIMKGDYKKWYIFTIAFSLLLFTHAIASLLMFITAVIIMLIYYKSFVRQPKRLLYLFLSGVVTLPIISYYLLPMLEQMASNTFYYQTASLTSLSENRLSNYSIIKGFFNGFVYPMQAFTPGVGLILTCGIALRLFVYKKSAELKSVDMGVCIGLFFIFATSFFFPWEVFPFSKLEIIQMPWRLLQFTSYFFAVAGGYYLSQIGISKTRLFVAASIMIIVTTVMMVNDSKLYHDTRCSLGIEREYLAENNYHLIGLEYLPSKIPSLEYMVERGQKVIADTGSQIADAKRDKNITYFDVNTDRATVLELPLVYYKGYKAELNGQETSVSESENGLVQISVDKPGRVEVYYAGTTVQKVSFVLTILSIIGLIVFIVLQNRAIKTKDGER